MHRPYVWCWKLICICDDEGGNSGSVYVVGCCFDGLNFGGLNEIRFDNADQKPLQVDNEWALDNIEEVSIKIFKIKKR